MQMPNQLVADRRPRCDVASAPSASVSHCALANRPVRRSSRECCSARQGAGPSSRSAAPRLVRRTNLDARRRYSRDPSGWAAVSPARSSQRGERRAVVVLLQCFGRMWPRLDGLRALELGTPGEMRVRLNDLVVAGLKTATAGTLAEYEREGGGARARRRAACTPGRQRQLARDRGGHGRRGAPLR
jgi:hypothetical protein